MKRVLSFWVRVCFLISLVVLVSVIALPAGLSMAETGKDTEKVEGVKDAEDILTKININTAGQEELIQLKGIGEALAQRIIEYREENGNFDKVEDIVNVKGIGPKILEENLNVITVDEQVESVETEEK